MDHVTYVERLRLLDQCLLGIQAELLDLQLVSADNQKLRSDRDAVAKLLGVDLTGLEDIEAAALIEETLAQKLGISVI